MLTFAIHFEEKQMSIDRVNYLMRFWEIVRKVIFLTLIFFVLSTSLFAKDIKLSSLSGIVVDETNKPIPYCTVFIDEINQWSVTELNGKFKFNLPEGSYKLIVSCLGYQTKEELLYIPAKEYAKRIMLRSKSYDLDDVIVTATRGQKNVTTSYNISSEAIDHTQFTSLGEIMALLPGARTKNSNLLSVSSRQVALRSNTNEEDRPSFGSAIEVDGIRMSNNGSFYSYKGIDTRIISSENINTVEVVTGIPSVEYGDLTSGIIKVDTKRGVQPFAIKAAISPRQKLVALSKGLALGGNRGILNLSYDYTKSVANLVSPYTSYVRNTFSLNHTKFFLSNTDKPISLKTTLAGNIGGYNSKDDPDVFTGTYEKEDALNIRGGVDLSWELNNKFISELGFGANFNYSDLKYEEKYKDSSASGELAFHGTEEGYFVGKPYVEGKPFSEIQLLKRGHWYQQKLIDNKPLNYALKFKLKKNFQLKNIRSNFHIGVDYYGSGNRGTGLCYGNRAYTPTWREHNFSEEPYLNNLALYAEGEFSYSLKKGQAVRVVLGAREDNTFVKDSKYKNVRAVSPRLNIEYSFVKNNTRRLLENLSIYGGWGEAIKLPSLGVLYIRPSYRERLAFVPGSLADGTTYYAYHIKPNEVVANKALKWQKSRKWEIGIKGSLKYVTFSLAYFNNVVMNSYENSYYYTPATYYLTTPYQLDNVKIPYVDRKYSISPEGTVTVHDKNKLLPDEVLEKIEKKSFNATLFADNSSPVRRHGLEWILDFREFTPLRTSLRIDGKYYFYKILKDRVVAYNLGDNKLMSDGQPYQYIGYYYGGNSISNGLKTKELSSNATIITHIPKLKLIVSLKIEGTFINYSQRLSQMPNGERAFVLDKRNGYIPKPNTGSIYTDNNFVGMYPLYYTSYDDMNTKVPFREKYLWAYEHNKTLYNDLTKMVVTSNYNYLFRPNRLSSYFSANIKVSKEIGQKYKLSFFANNFLNTLQKVRGYNNGGEQTLYNNGLVAPFYYGMSLKIKL